MIRTVSARLELELSGPSELVLEVAAAERSLLVSEKLAIVSDGREVVPIEVVDRLGSRLHSFDGTAGRMSIEYSAQLNGAAEPAAVDPLDLIEYLRPSRYCESDSLLPTARSEFAGLSGVDLINAVRSWVGARLSYVPGSSRGTDGAVGTLLARQGVCRDYAHLVIALLRAIDVPARMVAVYAPGLSPMDFHAVAEAYVEGGWQIVDATGLAPRQSLVRISTGRDAADTAFLTNHQSDLRLLDLQVLAIVDQLPSDDHSGLLRLN